MSGCFKACMSAHFPQSENGIHRSDDSPLLQVPNGVADSIKFQLTSITPQDWSVSMYFFNCYLAAPWPTLGIIKQGDSLTHPMLITCVLHIWHKGKGHREPCNKVGSLSPVKWLVGFEPEPSDSELTRPFSLIFDTDFNYVYGLFWQ